MLHKIQKADKEVRLGEWNRESNRGEELDGKTVGIIGYGNNGAAFAKKLRGFDVRVLAYDKYKSGFGDHFVQECTLNAILEQADVISFHIPQNKETRSFLNKEFVASMQKPFYLLNLSRGKIVDTAALVEGLQNGKIKGVVATDTVSNNIYSIRGNNIINATGVFSKSIMDMDSNKFKSVIRPSQGVHLVVDKTFLKGKFGILVPKTSDGRVLFAVPWLDNVIIGTTDSVVDKPTFNPVATQIEIDFILENLKNYLEFYPKRKDIKSVFVGLRPLVASNLNSKSKDLSRKHKILVSESGLVSVIGGKWTTYRKMANKVIDIALKKTNLPFVKSDTGNIKIENGLRNIDFSKKSLSHDFFLTKEMIIHYVRNEMALNLDDIMSRRSRCVFLNTKESIRIAPKVVEIMSKELSKDEAWIKEQLKTFYSLTNINKI